METEGKKLGSGDSAMALLKVVDKLFRCRYGALRRIWVTFFLTFVMMFCL